MGLQQEIDAQRSEIRTDGYPMSVGELISLYEHDLTPEGKLQLVDSWQWESQDGHGECVMEEV